VIKIISLFLSLLLLILGLWGLLFVNFPSLIFNWEDFLFYLVIAAIVYLIIRAVGGSLNKEFNKSVNEFLKGKRKSLFDNKRLLHTFGFLLITLLPFLLYLMLFALYSAITFALYGFLGISYLQSVPIGILIGLAVVAIGTTIAILIGFYYLFFPPRIKILSVEIKKGEQKRLWELINKLANEIKAKPINKILITPDPGIGVYLEGGLPSAIFGGKRVLKIGIPSIHNLTVGEFKAILAHEYGHLSNRDTQWASFTYSMGNSLIRTLQSIPGPTRDGKKEGGGIINAIISLNPAYWILFLFVDLYFKITNGFSRIREVMADMIAISLYGSEAFINGLLKVATNDLIFNEIIQRVALESLEKGQVIANLSKFLRLVYEQLKKDGSYVKEVKKVLFSNNVDNVYNSHPPLKIRLNYAKKFGVTKEIEGEKVELFFDNWDELNKKVTELYNLRLLAYLKALSEIHKKVKIIYK